MFIINFYAQSSNRADRGYYDYVVDWQCMQPGVVKLIISNTQMMDCARTVAIYNYGSLLHTSQSYIFVLADLYRCC